MKVKIVRLILSDGGYIYVNVHRINYFVESQEGSTHKTILYLAEEGATPTYLKDSPEIVWSIIRGDHNE